VDAVAEVTRESWANVYELPILEFLNVLAYRRDKQAEQDKQREQWRRTH